MVSSPSARLGRSGPWYSGGSLVLREGRRCGPWCGSCSVVWRGGRRCQADFIFGAAFAKISVLTVGIVVGWAALEPSSPLFSSATGVIAGNVVGGG